MNTELKLKEYEMLRQEILQYLEEYQNLRNMMYIITVTLLGFCLTGENTIVYAFLLPLVVTLPSLIISYDYWKCVVKAATYLRVFHEKDVDYPCHWETRHNNFNKIYNFTSKSDYQELPYALCSCVCVLLYFLNIDYSKCFVIEIVVGILAVMVTVFVFVKYRNVNVEKFIDAWGKIKENEERISDGENNE